MQMMIDICDTLVLTVFDAVGYIHDEHVTLRSFGAVFQCVRVMQYCMAYVATSYSSSKHLRTNFYSDFEAYRGTWTSHDCSVDVFQLEF